MGGAGGAKLGLLGGPGNAFEELPWGGGRDVAVSSSRAAESIVLSIGCGGWVDGWTAREGVCRGYGFQGSRESKSDFILAWIGSNKRVVIYAFIRTKTQISRVVI